MKKIYIRTYGCQMNDYDTSKLTSLFLQNGYKITDTPYDANYIIVNTCSVRKTAEDRAFAFLSSQKPLKKKGTKLCLFGCAATLYKEQLFKKYPFIDIICSPDNYNEILKIFKTGQKKCLTKENLNPFLDVTPSINETISAGVTITKGCENFCSYCVVPFTRGKLISRQPEDILQEVEDLTKQGVIEIFLLGQNVNEYGKDINLTFTHLLERVDKVEKVLRIGFTTSHPKDISKELIELFKKNSKLYKHLHLPLQSGSNKILQLMNRKYNIEQYLEIIKDSRKKYPEITITSDIIVGYPGETEKDFEETYKIVKEIEFDDLFIFQYSSRPGTVASLSKDIVKPEEKSGRHKLLIDLQDKISYKKNKEYIGKKLPVFLRNKRGKKEGFLIGRTITNKPVILEADIDYLGKVCQVEITDVHRRYLVGKVFC